MIKWRKIEDLLEYTGKGITPKYVDESSIIVLNQKCIRNNKIDYSFSRFTDDTKNINKDKFVRKGDVLFNSTGTGTAGRCAFVAEIPKHKRVIVDSHILILRFENYYEAQCLSYSFHSIETQIQSFMDGSTGQGELDKVRVFNLLTSLTENHLDQETIAKVLSDLDAKIELNNKINRQLEAMAKTLYGYWFVQFDFPNTNGNPYKSSGGKMVYDEKLKREIPEGWESGELIEIANITTGKLDSNAEVSGGNYPFYTCARNPTEIDCHAFDDNVILIAGNNAAGNFHINRYKGKFNAYQRTYIITSKNQINMEYLFQVLKTEMLNLKKRGKGSQTKFITIEMLTSINIFSNSNSLIENFNVIAKPLFDKQSTLNAESKKLTKLRDWLLPMLMNGQVTVEEAQEEIQMNMAAEPKAGYKL